MYLTFALAYILFGAIYQTNGKDSSGSLYRVYDITKFIPLSNSMVTVKSQIQCALLCQMSNCCGASYYEPGYQCYLRETDCYDVVNTEPRLGWRTLRKGWKTIYVAIEKTWDDAQTYCASLGGHLARVTTSAKHDLIMQFRDGTHSAWVGASDREVEANWIWYNPKKPVMLDYWGVNRPDNYLGIQHCLAYTEYLQYLWNDFRCEDSLHFICDV